MYPSDDFASEKEYLEEWNALNKIDAIIEDENRQIKFAEKCAEKRAHYSWTKERIAKARENFSQAQ